MKNCIACIVLTITSMQVRAQSGDTLTLQLCMKIAGERSTIARQKQLSGLLYEGKRKNLSTNWLPAIGIQAQAAYNSETLDFSGAMGSLPAQIPTLPLDQYKVWADFNQHLFDGGGVKAQKSIERNIYESDLHDAEKYLLTLKQLVTQLYFSILITKKSIEIFRVTEADFDARGETVASGIRNGVLQEEDGSELEAEAIRVSQSITELSMVEYNLFSTLAELLDTSWSTTGKLITPNDFEINTGEVHRPEHLWFESQRSRLSANQKLIHSQDLPRLFAFSQLAYGRPGYDMLNTDFHTFYTIGMGMKWNFLNYGDNRRQRKMLDIQKELVSLNEENFDEQLAIQLQGYLNEEMKYNQLMTQDSALVAIRKSIADLSSQKLTSGVITSADYIHDLNAYTAARLQLENHRLLRLQALYLYCVNTGIL